MCLHHNYKKAGFDRKGKQRIRCTLCGSTRLAERGWHTSNRLSPEKEFRLALAMSLGLTDRQIIKQLGVSHVTIVRRRAKWSQVEPPKQVAKGSDRCDYCGNKIAGDREAYRKTRRTEHKFCDQKCYGLYQRATSANDVCKRCKRKRKDVGLCVIFSKGMCNPCYNLLRQFNFNEDQAALFETTQRLKKEIRNVENKRRR